MSVKMAAGVVAAKVFTAELLNEPLKAPDVVPGMGIADRGSWTSAPAKPGEPVIPVVAYLQMTTMGAYASTKTGSCNMILRWCLLDQLLLTSSVLHVPFPQAEVDNMLRGARLPFVMSHRKIPRLMLMVPSVMFPERGNTTELTSPSRFSPTLVPCT